MSTLKEAIKDTIADDLSRVILEEEYPRVKEFLSIKGSDIGYNEILRYINEISDATFTASRLLIRMEEEYMKFKESVYDVGMAEIRSKVTAELEKQYQETKLKSSLTEKKIDDAMLINQIHKPYVLQLKERKRWFESHIATLKSLHKRLEARESLSQTYSRLQEKRTEIVFKENRDETE